MTSNDWNYIIPDARGNNEKENIKAFNSKYVMNDINDAIKYAVLNFKVNVNNIYVVGISCVWGGRYGHKFFG